MKIRNSLQKGIPKMKTLKINRQELQKEKEKYSTAEIWRTTAPAGFNGGNFEYINY
jgi:hypothetical protein